METRQRARLIAEVIFKRNCEASRQRLLEAEEGDDACRPKVPQDNKVETEIKKPPDVKGRNIREYVVYTPWSRRQTLEIGGQGQNQNNVQPKSVEVEEEEEQETCEALKTMYIKGFEESKDKDVHHDSLEVSEKDSIILAVDATPTRGGGLLRLPGAERTIFFYSVNWSSHFSFPDEPPKFEMVNAAVALKLFEPYLKAYRSRYGNFVLKTDSNFYNSLKGFKDPYDFDCLVKVRENVKALGGVFRHTLVSQNDVDIKNADYLSRTEFPIGMKVLYSDESDSEDGQRQMRVTDNYALIDLSKTVEYQILDNVSEVVPGRFVKGQCGEVITANSQSKNKDCSRFLMMLLRYLNVSPRATSDLDLSKEICEDCRTIGNAFCDLYVQLEGTRLQLEWKVRKIFDMMRCADKVPSRFKAFENQVLGETRNGRVAHHNKVKRMRAEVYNNCKAKITSGPPSICLTKYVSNSGPEEPMANLNTRVRVPVESFPQSVNISPLADAHLELQQSICTNDIKGEESTKEAVETLQELEESKDNHNENTGEQEARSISGTPQSAENRANMDMVSRNTHDEEFNGNRETKPPKAAIITEIGGSGMMESSNLKRISVDRSTHTDKTDENEDKWSELPEEEPVPIEVIIKLDNKYAKLEDSDEDFHLSEVEYENSSDEASSDERKFNMARHSSKHNPSDRDRGTNSAASSKQHKREQVKTSTSSSPVNVVQQRKRELLHKCTHCRDLFRTKKALSCHLKDQHSRKENLKQIPYKCSICGNTFQVKHSFESHMLMHKTDGGNFQCTVCDRTFSRKNLLKIHMKAHGRHENEKNPMSKNDTKLFCCHLCKKRFKENSKLTQHKLAVHKGSKKLKKCMTSQKLAVHRRMHARKKSSECKCHICSKAYVHPRNLLNHMKNIHNATPGTTRKKSKAPNKGIPTCKTKPVGKIS